MSHFHLSLSNIIAAAVIAVLGFLLAYSIKRYLLQKIKREENEHTVKLFLCNLFYTLVLIIVTIMVLGKLGVPTTSLITLVGASSIAIGLSLKDSLSNIAAGILLVFLKPFRIGDTVVVNSITGTVCEINLYNTKVVTANNGVIYFPNNTILNQSIKNLSQQSTRRYVLPLCVAFDTNIEKLTEILLAELKACSLCLDNPTPHIVVVNINNGAGITVEIRAWANTDKMGDFQMKLPGIVVAALQANSIVFARGSSTAPLK